MEFQGRNRHPVSAVIMHDMTGCNLGGGILCYQDKHLWLLLYKQSSTSRCTLPYGLPFSFHVSKTGRKNFLTSGIFTQQMLTALVPTCSILLVRGEAGVKGWHLWSVRTALLCSQAASAPEEAWMKYSWLDTDWRIVEQFWIFSVAQCKIGQLHLNSIPTCFLFVCLFSISWSWISTSCHLKWKQPVIDHLLSLLTAAGKYSCEQSQRHESGVL